MVRVHVELGNPSPLDNQRLVTEFPSVQRDIATSPQARNVMRWAQHRHGDVTGSDGRRRGEARSGCC